MGVLAPLYLAGLAALSLPLIFHLIRRTPRGRLPFSSLMFLSPSPPRLTRRSRLDQILLLLLRAAALALLAFAFARPFFREAATLAMGDVPRRRVALLIDTSASMRRGDLWQQTKSLAERELANLGPHDDVALYAYSDRLHTLVEFEKDQALPPVGKADVLRQRLKTLQPGWGGTDLGTALVTVASELEVAGDVDRLAADPHVVLIGDLAQGTRTEALQGFEWPKSVRVVVHQLVPDRPTNAFAHLLASEEGEREGEVRVRVVNSEGGAGDQFFVRWQGDEAQRTSGEEAAIYVPPGQSRVIRLPRSANNLFADQVVLRGDDHAFDNRHYVVPLRPQEVELVYLGADGPDDPQGMQYYLRAALADDPLRKVTFQSRDQWPRSVPADGTPQRAFPTALIVATGPLSSDDVTALQEHMARGGTLLLAPRDGEAAATVANFLDDVELREAPPLEEGEYLLLGDIDFSHPLFAPLSSPRYSDFTKIHFWQRRPLQLEEGTTTKTIARFDNGDPALLERINTQVRSASERPGRVLLLASGWHPDDSQLALSTKFVPLMQALIDYACGSAERGLSLTVGEELSLPDVAPQATRGHLPGGKQVALAAGDKRFTETDVPGIYRLVSAAGETKFAVNLAPAESNTAPLNLEQLEQWGVKLGTSLTRAERIDRERQQRDTELEARQQLWRWLLVGALGLLIGETWWAGRAARHYPSPEDVR
jgi:hypothetical protein